MQKDTEKLVQNTSWENEFDKKFAAHLWDGEKFEDARADLVPAHMVKLFIKELLSNRENEIADEVEKESGACIYGEHINKNKILSILKH